jgi:hypothetical protein
MDPEVEVVAEVIPASDSSVTVASESEISTPVESTPEAAKVFSQEELDAAIGKRLAREQRKWERERQVAPVAVPVATDLRLDQFDSTEAYAEALATQKAERLVEQRESQRQLNAVVEAYHDREEEARGKYDDFDQIAYNPQLRITDVMAQAIQSSDLGPEVAYHLGTNPKEAERISKLAPLVQAREIGRLEAKLASAPPIVKKTSNAAPPIVPVTARGAVNPTYDTTDPRSIKTMTTSEWIAADRARQIRKMEAAMR